MSSKSSYDKFLKSMQSGLAMLDKSHQIHKTLAAVNPQSPETDPQEGSLDIPRIKNII